MMFLRSRFMVVVYLVLLLLPESSSISFDFKRFEPNMDGMIFQGDAYPTNGAIQVTRNQRDGNLTRSVGRASYALPVRIWDRKSRRLSDFNTHFSFTINALNSSSYGDGLAFFLAPFHAGIPPNSSAGYLGLFRNTTQSPDPNPAENQIVAVEFDTFKDVWDPSPDHVGIDINSIESVKHVDWRNSIKTGAVANAWVTYDSATKNLSVFLTYANSPTFSGNSTVSYVVDLSKVLPEMVQIGFSAATGEWIELHTILSWSFRSSLDSKKPKKLLPIFLSIGIVLFVSILGFILFIRWRKVRKNLVVFGDASMEEDFQKGAGPKRFTFWELSRATNNFSEEGKLGEGGFGGVYKGVLSEKRLEVAVKRVSRGSKQGKKEYVSEVRVISRLRHRNLVQLVGWCHEKGEFLLVYEYMANGSLDSHLFGKKPGLTWGVRYKIAQGLGSALLYLHEEWEQCVVHRDIKSSNIMLDSNYNIKLGDFGLARLVDHELGSQTTVLAGTMGYLAPECVTTGKASKESDVYSFGVVALEIACGRRPVEPKAEAGKVRLVEWVWDLYGEGKILEGADKGLNMEFDEKEMECLMVVGLWCCHPDHTLRPSIKQVINALNFEAPLPKLPAKLPVAMYFAPPMSMCRFSYTSSADHTDSWRYTTRCSCRNGCNASAFLASSKALLTPRDDSAVHTHKTMML
ncbi:L-type lectin-domain containing receptor kinase IX.1-like [Ipomoea triloba]|uniref:L-type lectin-domain containing receptor kinase IX.1-like n=1 Tax=Ipomoea triloba TaxID=35885 RepID=UPI00125DDB3A|nr:L-type lectin-domain containing receptor kinase IX.1-like [Ipomoea triloba]